MFWCLEKEIREAWNRQREGKEKIVVGTDEEEAAAQVTSD